MELKCLFFSMAPNHPPSSSSLYYERCCFFCLLLDKSWSYHFHSVESANAFFAVCKEVTVGLIPKNDWFTSWHLMTGQETERKPSFCLDSGSQEYNCFHALCVSSHTHTRALGVICQKTLSDGDFTGFSMVGPPSPTIFKKINDSTLALACGCLTERNG